MEVMSNCREKGEKEEVLGEDEILKKRISSHPSYGQLVEAHLGCLKVGAMVKFDRNHIRDQIKQQGNNPSSLGMASSSATRSELDHFMESDTLTCTYGGKAHASFHAPIDVSISQTSLR
ncbi:hypothetical protein I3842_15G131900 [Carya illinoinensis]|uniref:KNOX1 domain-containing protein n=1 Tax=Carya illinoinensis TaxID=32201 RepID=A0A922AE56_CARIL|nr:hypothetical protein I3842_15G131900 [Carya illinoinensis]